MIVPGEEYGFDEEMTPEDALSQGVQDEIDFEDESDFSENEENDIDINEFDFSDFSGADARTAISRIHNRIDKKRQKKKKKVKKSKTAQVVTPSGKKINVKDISKIIIGNAAANQFSKNFGWHKGKRLKLLIFTFDNTNSAIDFNFSLFDPSMPLDYFMATGLDLNSKILVAGGGNGNIQYSDVLFNILANPTLIYQAKFTMAGAFLTQQMNEPLEVANKDIDGKYVISPIQTLNLIDTFQAQGDIVNFDMQNRLPYTFIPDGMDVMNYKVYAGMTVTFAFAYKQVSLKEKMFPEEMKKNIRQQLT